MKFMSDEFKRIVLLPIVLAITIALLAVPASWLGVIGLVIGYFWLTKLFPF